MEKAKSLASMIVDTYNWEWSCEPKTFGTPWTIHSTKLMSKQLGMEGWNEDG